jgi:hypothetical protein
MLLFSIIYLKLIITYSIIGQNNSFDFNVNFGMNSYFTNYENYISLFKNFNDCNSVNSNTTNSKTTNSNKNSN